MALPNRQICQDLQVIGGRIQESQQLEQTQKSQAIEGIRTAQDAIRCPDQYKV